MVRYRCHDLTACLMVMLILLTGAVQNSWGNGKAGEALFQQHCAVCHPGGGNIMSPKKTLNKKDREANGIKSKDDIVRFMRKPGPGMTTFDSKLISDKDAEEIAEYIRKTFK